VYKIWVFLDVYACVCLATFFRQLMWQSVWQVQAKYLDKTADKKENVFLRYS